jgi:hypothetical protein
MIIWWRGRGLWILFLALAPAATASATGGSGTAIALAASAVLIFLANDALGPDASLFSLSPRIWSVLLLCFALLVQFGPARTQRAGAGGNLKRTVTDLQASLPRMLNDKIRIDHVEDGGGNVLRYSGTSLVPFTDVPKQKATFEQQVRKSYCDDPKKLWRSKVSIAFTLRVPPESLNDKVVMYSVEVQPQECQPPPSSAT